MWLQLLGGLMPLCSEGSVWQWMLSCCVCCLCNDFLAHASKPDSLFPSPPLQWARDFVGRLMADPAFVQKLVIEQILAAAASLYYEYQARGGENFKKELDLVAINTLGMMAATGATTWIVAPTRSYGSLHKYPWQQMLSNLPNCVFDASGPLRTFSKQARLGGFAARMAELSAVGVLTGTATSLSSQAAVALHRRSNPEYQPSVAVPNIGRSSGGMGAFFALNANVRYQLLGGLDRYLFERSNFLWTYVGATLVARTLSNRVGELSRPWWQGLPEAQAMQQQRAAQQQQQPGRVRRVRRVKKSSAAARQQQQAAAESAFAAGAAASLPASAGAVPEASSTPFTAPEASTSPLHFDQASSSSSRGSSPVEVSGQAAADGYAIDHSLPLVMVAPNGSEFSIDSQRSTAEGSGSNQLAMTASRS